MCSGFLWDWVLLGRVSVGVISVSYMLHSGKGDKGVESNKSV
jgi:hypothetical protein